MRKGREVESEMRKNSGSNDKHRREKSREKKGNH
jgi:hypothetical protein